MSAKAGQPSAREAYPHSELEVFLAGYERGREFLRVTESSSDRDALLAEELASRRLTMFDLTREGLLILGLEAPFVPRSLFDAGVRRALEEVI